MCCISRRPRFKTPAWLISLRSLPLNLSFLSYTTFVVAIHQTLQRLFHQISNKIFTYNLGLSPHVTNYCQNHRIAPTQCLHSTNTRLFSIRKFSLRAACTKNFNIICNMCVVQISGDSSFALLLCSILTGSAAPLHCLIRLYKTC